MNKKGIAFESIVVAILVLITFAALIPLYSKFITITSTAVVDRLCHASALANAYGRVPVADTELFNLDCPRKLTSVTFKGIGKGIDVETKVKVGDKEQTFKDTYSGYTRAQDSIKKYSFDEKDEDMFVINNAIADQVTQCWENMGMGELPLFSKWWSYLKLGNEDDSGKWSQIKSKFPRYQDSPVNCVICSRIVFDDKTKEFFRNKKIEKITSMEEWLKKNPLPGSNPAVSYFETLLDDIHIGIFEGENFVYDVNEPMAVVFTRISTMKATDFATKIATALPGYSEEDRPKAVDAIYLWPYAELGNRCTILYN